MTEPERIEVKIGEQAIGLVLPGNGRFYTVRTCTGDIKILYRTVDKQKHLVYYSHPKDNQACDFRWFSDACDNAAEWHWEQQAHYFDKWENETAQNRKIALAQKNKEHAAQVHAWRAAKAAYLAPEKEKSEREKGQNDGKE